jgi:4-amino-4-deoxy-L-arabinose transferase-like glycosyltransferase
MKKISSFCASFCKNEKLLINALLGFSLVVFFVFGFNHLSKFISADEHFWIPGSGAERIEKYWVAIKNADWADTRINDKPGITLAYTSGVAMLFEKANGMVKEKDGTYKIYNPERTEQINFAYRFPILLISGLFAFFFFWIIRKITENDWIALFSVGGILLSPILIGMSQIVNPDSLFWLFGSGTFLTFFAFLKFDAKKYAIISGILMGLALASKYVSVIFFPFFFAMMLGYFLFTYQQYRERKNEFSVRIKRAVLAYFSILICGVVIFALMMPAVFVDPIYLWEGTIGFGGMAPIFAVIALIGVMLLVESHFLKSKYTILTLEKLQPLKAILPKITYAILLLSFLFVLVNWITRHTLLDLTDIPFDAKRSVDFGKEPFYKKYLMEFVALTFSLTPITLFTLLFVWIKSLFQKTKHEFLIFMLSAFFLVFYIAVIKEGLLVTTRYSIILYPFSMILGAIAIDEFFSIEKTKANVRALMVYLLTIGGVLFLQMFSLAQQDMGRAGKDLFEKYAENPLVSGLVIIGFLAVLFFAAKRYFPWNKLTKVSKVCLFVIFAGLNIASIMMITPFYFSYTNDLLPKKYIISGAWGYGGYEAAQFLNAMPNAKKMTLWTDVYGVCEFFEGKCIHKAKVDTDKYKIDYYFRSLQATVPLKFSHPMEDEPVWRMRIDERPKSFLKLQKASN